MLQVAALEAVVRMKNCSRNAWRRAAIVAARGFATPQPTAAAEVGPVMPAASSKSSLGTASSVVQWETRATVQGDKSALSRKH